jgi:hypothetical protein
MSRNDQELLIFAIYMLAVAIWTVAYFIPAPSL